MKTTTRIAIAALLAAPILATLPGCFNPFNPLESTSTGFTEPAPVPDTPTELMNLFKWCWEHRDPYRYSEIFTDDFQYVFAVADTEGNSQPDRSYTRTDEIESARHLFTGGKVGVEPATRITLDFDSDILPLPDNRPDKPAATHREILTGVNLSIDTDVGNFRVKSTVRFFVVRGDDALIPQELIDRGFSTEDTKRWYIERWQDETLPGSGLVTASPDGFGASAAARGAVTHPGPRATRASRYRPEGAGSGFYDVTWGFIKRRFH